VNARFKNFLGILIFVVFLGLAYFAYQDLTTGYKTQQENQLPNGVSSSNNTKKSSAPDFTVFDEQGQEIKLSDFKGKPVILNFWASWCPPCRNEMPHFNEVYSQAGEDVVFMMVDLVDGQRETQAKGQAFIDEQGYDFPVYFDNDQNAARIYGISAIPTTYFINPEGNIVKAYQGAIDKDTLQKGIELINK
jgi:thiol-disulfide isomerase/thioredoxin